MENISALSMDCVELLCTKMSGIMMFFDYVKDSILHSRPYSIQVSSWCFNDAQFLRCMTDNRYINANRFNIEQEAPLSLKLLLQFYYNL